MHHLDLILTLTGGLATALVLGYLTHRFGLSPIVGYLVGGIVIGPHTPGFVANQALAEQLAEVGVILLMFGVGLQFHLTELLAVRRVALPGAVGQICVATGLGTVVALVFGWDWGAGIVFGLALSVASTVVLLRVLADHRALHTPTGHIAVGWLVVEDLCTVLVLVLLPAVFGGSSAGLGPLLLALGVAALKLTVLVGFTLLVGGRLIPWLLERVATTRSRELFTLIILVLALGIAVGSAMLFGVSMALGAFLAGMVVGRSDFSLRAASEALPMRDAFAVLFFVSVGMLPRETLQGAGVERAGSLILSAAGMSASAEVIRLARELNPSIRILARAAYAREIPPLYQAGAERVFSGEVEVALAFTEAILRTLGATPDQIDQERDRVHRDLFDKPTVAAQQDAAHG